MTTTTTTIRSREESARVRREHSALDAVRAGGGVIRSARLRAAGHPKHTIARLVDRGALQRIRRVWVALPDADPLAVAAARAGVVVSCVTQAERLGLWVRSAGGLHVAAPSAGAAVDVARGTVVHWGRPLLPRRPGELFDGVENALALLVACQPDEHAFAAIESAMRMGLVDRESLLALRLPATLRTLVEAATPWSDSGLESIFVRRLRWLRLPIVPQAWILGHRVDFLIGARLIVQIDGGHHVGPQRERDIAHDAQLMLRGYHVIRVSYAQIMTEWPAVQDMIMRAVALGLHLSR